MASITKDAHQPPKSPFWIACFNGVGSDGRVRRLKRSTKTTDRKLAQRLADEWEQLEKLAGKGRLTESHCRKVIAQMYEHTVGEPLHFRTTREHLSERHGENYAARFGRAAIASGVTRENSRRPIALLAAAFVWQAFAQTNGP